MADAESLALTDAEILRSVDETVLGVLLPALRDDAEWERAMAIQLVGLVRYARRRRSDQTASRVAEIAGVFDRLRENGIVAAVWSGDRSAAGVMRSAADALAAAVVRDDDAAREVRDVLRPVLVRQLDDELAETTPLVDAFRGDIDG